jgi:hypothetical protein
MRLEGEMIAKKENAAMSTTMDEPTLRFTLSLSVARYQNNKMRMDTPEKRTMVVSLPGDDASGVVMRIYFSNLLVACCYASSYRFFNSVGVHELLLAPRQSQVESNA